MIKADLFSLRLFRFCFLLSATIVQVVASGLKFIEMMPGKFIYMILFSFIHI